MKRIRLWAARALLLWVAVSVLPILVLRWLPPPTTAVILQRTIAEGTAQDYRWVPLERISPQAALAAVAAEDQKFPEHWGFDLEAIHEAIAHGASGGRLRGASTLSQQVARNLFLWQGRSYLRKALEAWLTGLLELLWPKRRILETYLNIAEMGERTFGVEAAARRFFGRPACALGPRQSALLAAALPNPRRYSVENPGDYLIRRRDWVLRQMSQLGGPAYLRGIVDPDPTSPCAEHAIEQSG